MRINRRGVEISEIFQADEGESISIDAGASIVTLCLMVEGRLKNITYYTESFRQLLTAMNVADQELIDIERRRNSMPTLNTADRDER